MKITRRGSAADHGPREIGLSSPTFQWSSSKACLSIRQGRVKDFTTSAHHSYNVEISPEEINAILEALAKTALADPKAIERHLASSLKSLVQLQSVVAGLYPSNTDRQ